MYKKNIENTFEIGSHKITTEFFELDKLSERESKILANAIKSGVVEVVDELQTKSLVELYNEDRNIIDTLKIKDLKKLCKDLDVEFTNEAEIREHLKAMEVLEDK